MTYRSALALFLALFATAAPATPPDQIVRAEVLTGWRTASGSHIAALHLTLAPGWKTYWRSPGEAGIPPVLSFAGSANIDSAQVHWPQPEVFDFNGMQTIGYTTDVILPVEFGTIDPAQPIRLRAAMDMGVCNDICVPARVELAATLPAPGAPDAGIARALAQGPASGHAAGLTRIACTVVPISDGLRLRAEIDLPRLGPAETVVVEAPLAAIWVSEATSARDGGRLTAEADLIASDGGAVALDRSALVVTVLADGRSVEIRGCPAP